MSFKITVVETKYVTITKRGEYAIVGQQYISTSDYIKLSAEEQKDFKFWGNCQYLKNIFGYPDPKEVTIHEEIKIYEQVVDTLDVYNVISAVNG